MMVKKHYIVETHVGDEQTIAVSPAKAKSNVMFRLRARGGYVTHETTQYWRVREV